MGRSGTNISGAFLTLAGVILVVCALGYNRLSVDLAVAFVRGAFDRPWTAAPSASAIVLAQVTYLVAGASCLILRWLLTRSERLDTLFRDPAVEKLVLATVVLALPLASLEISLRPFTERLGKETSLFVRDDNLGWRMRESVNQEWGGVSISTNEHGLRGPAVPYERTEGKRRILWLGDSVTFGYGVAADSTTFPWLVAEHLGERGIGTETVNAGVGGYSPWQELSWLADEGRRYHPDVVVVGFVPNDVTEKFKLIQYGGREEARQLRDSYYSWVDRLFARSALATQIRNITREVKAKRALSDDVRLGAVKQEMLDVQTLIRRPNQENVRIAWEITIESLDGIADLCADEGFTLVVAAFPFAVQIEDPVGLRAPQRVLEEWSARRGVVFVDLLPVLAMKAAIGTATDELFIDHDLLTPLGHSIVAKTLAREILNKMN